MNKTADAGKKTGFAAFLERKNIQFSPQRYGIDALSAMAQGLFASLLIGTIISTLGKQLGIQVLQDIGGYASSATGRRRHRRQLAGRCGRPPCRPSDHYRGR